MTTSRRSAPLVLSLALALGVAAQNTPAPTATTTKATTFTIDPGSHALPALIDRVAAFLDCNILYNTQEVESSGELRVTRRTEVDTKGCWELFGSLLHLKGLAMVTLDQERGFHEVISMHGPRQREIANGAMFVKPENVEAYANAKATPIITTVPLKNINATIATNALRPFFAGTGAPSGSGSLTIGNVGNNTEILVQGFGPQVAAACRLLRLVDARGDEPVAKLQVVRIEHGNAATIASCIEAIWAGQQTSQQAQGMPYPVPVQRVVVHTASNAVVLSGSTASITEAMELIAKLDTPALAPKPETTDLLRRIEQLEAKLAALEGQKAPK